jgi:hypothetical protein
MKLYTLLVLTLLCISLDIVPCAKITLKAGTKKFKSMIELLEEYGKNEEEPATSNNTSINNLKKVYRKGRHLKAQNATNVTKLDPFIFVNDFTTLELVHQGWLKVSSVNFKNKNRFPELHLPDWSTQEIPTEYNFFRRNQAFKQEAGPNDPPTDRFFWMRLSKRNFYYTVSKDSVEAQDSIASRDIRDAKTLKDFNRDDRCFQVKDRREMNWVLCAQTKDERNEWVCKIKEFLRKIDFHTCLKATLSDDIPIVIKKILQPVIMMPFASPMCNENFNYNSLGADWECDCKDGNK